MLKFLATNENAKIITSKEPIYNHGKVVEKSSGKLLFATSRHRNTRKNELEVDQSEYSVER